MSEEKTFSIDGPSHFYSMINQQVSYPELKSGEKMEQLGSCLIRGGCCGRARTPAKECDVIYGSIISDLKKDEEKMNKIKDSMGSRNLCFILNGNVIYESNKQERKN